MQGEKVSGADGPGLSAELRVVISMREQSDKKPSMDGRSPQLQTHHDVCA
jgi:hypothetical protein